MELPNLLVEARFGTTAASDVMDKLLPNLDMGLS
jgi:hypothetical protein